MMLSRGAARGGAAGTPPGVPRCRQGEGAARTRWEAGPQQPLIRHDGHAGIIRGAMAAAVMRRLSFVIMHTTIGGSPFQPLPRPHRETVSSRPSCAACGDLGRYRQPMTITRARAWHLLNALVCAASLALQFYLTWTNNNTDPSPNTRPLRMANFFSYFTIQSNLIVLAVAISLILLADRDGPFWRVVRLDALVCITVTCLV